MTYRLEGKSIGRGLLGVATLLAATASPAPSGEELFRIERNTNRNVVEYDIRLRADGTVDRDRPVTAFWRLLAEDGRREDLTWLERNFAYGFHVESDPGGFVLKLTALARRAVQVEKSGGRWHAVLDVAGKPAILRRVWVQADGTLLGPHVRWVELHGTDTRTGAPVVERIAN